MKTVSSEETRAIAPTGTWIPLLIRLAIWGLLLAILTAVYIEWAAGGSGMLDNLQGFTTRDFAEVEEVFKTNFFDGWEREGAAFAVYHRGELVVDLQAGYSDRASGRLWTNQTRTVVFSTGKAIGALCIAVLVDRGYLKYEDKMTKYWPEFEQNGKDNITIDWILTHRGGLAALDETITKAIANDPVLIADALAKQAPNWKLSAKVNGYHAFTLGWLMDEIVRRTDPLHRSVAQFFREEIAQKYGIDFHIGLPLEEEYTMSRISMPDPVHSAREIIYDPRVVGCIFSVHAPFDLPRRVRENPDWFKLQRDLTTYNDPDIHHMEQVADVGIGKARDLAYLFSRVIRGDVISRSLMDSFRDPEPGTSGIDLVLITVFPKGHGFIYEEHPTNSSRFLVGHNGYGGTSLMMDLDEEVVLSYVSNGLKTGLGSLTGTYRRLRDAVFACVERKKQKKPSVIIDAPNSS